MHINLVPVDLGKKDILFNLYQLYYYDFSKYTNQDLNKDGKYDLEINLFWEGDRRWHPFL